MGKITIKVSTNRTPQELLKEAREAYERRQTLEFQQSADSAHLDASTKSDETNSSSNNAKTLLTSDDQS